MHIHIDGFYAPARVRMLRQNYSTLLLLFNLFIIKLPKMIIWGKVIVSYISELKTY